MSSFATKIIWVNYWAVECFIKTLNQLTTSICSSKASASGVNCRQSVFGQRRQQRREKIDEMSTIDTSLLNASFHNHKLSSRLCDHEIWGRFQAVNYLWRRQFPQFPSWECFHLDNKHQKCARMKYSWRKSVWLPTWLCGIEAKKKLVNREAGNSDFSWEYAWLEAIILQITLSNPQNTELPVLKLP